MKKKNKPQFTQRELEELGIDGVDTKKSKAPVYRRNKRKREALELLKKYVGNVSAVCERIGVSRQTFYKWRQTDSEFDEAVHEVYESILDFAESQLLKGIREGNAKLIMFYLMNKGKARGYTPKPEDMTRGRALNVVISSDEAEF